MTLAVVLLAAGHGTRMNSQKQKVLHDVGGKPMVRHIFEVSAAVADRKPLVVVGAGEEGVPLLLGEAAEYVVQEKRLGTGHATLKARDALQGHSDQVLVTYGDMPLLTAETMQQLAQVQAETGAALSMLTVRGEPESSFGRVIRDGAGHVAEIVEVAEARLRDDTEIILNTRELNAGVYCFDASWLWENLPNIPMREARSGPEYYLTDMISLAVAQGRLVEALLADDPAECLGAGTRAELALVEQAFRQRINSRWLEAGVTMIDPDATYIDPDVTIGQDTIIWPNTYIQGQSYVGSACTLGPNTIIRDARIGDRCRVEQAVIEETSLADDLIVAPFSYLNQRE